VLAQWFGCHALKAFIGSCTNILKQPFSSKLNFSPSLTSLNSHHPELPLIISSTQTMSDSILSIWSRSPSSAPDPYSKYSPKLSPPSPKLQQSWSPRVNSKDRPRNDLLAQARVLAIFRSGRFPNKVETSSGSYDDLEVDTMDGLALDVYDHDGADTYNNGIRPDFHDDFLDAEESFSSSGSASSSRSTPVQDFIPHWYPLLHSVFTSRSEQESINACRTLVLSREWKYDDLSELAHTLVSSFPRQVPPHVIAKCAVNLKCILLDDRQHEAASYFVSCLAQSAFSAWHHYWNPVSVTI
jgi:hypothetical protein